MRPERRTLGTAAAASGGPEPGPVPDGFRLAALVASPVLPTAYAPLTAERARADRRSGVAATAPNED